MLDCHACFRFPTLDGVSTFSYGLYPVPVTPKRSCGQLVRTRKYAVADRWLVWPVAVTGYLPGCAVLGTVNAAVNVPVDEVTADWLMPNSVTVTVSLMPNPEPVTLTLVVGGPDVGFRVMLGVLALAAAGDANTPTARTMPAAAAISTRDRLRQRETPATIPASRPARPRIQETACVFMEIPLLLPVTDLVKAAPDTARGAHRPGGTSLTQLCTERIRRINPMSVPLGCSPPRWRSSRPSLRPAGTGRQGPDGPVGHGRCGPIGPIHRRDAGHIGPEDKLA